MDDESHLFLSLVLKYKHYAFNSSLTTVGSNLRPKSWSFMSAVPYIFFF